MTRLQTQPDEKIDFGDRLFLEFLATDGHGEPVSHLETPNNGRIVNFTYQFVNNVLRP